MFDITIITGLASLMGCICMALVCAAQVAELFAAARPAAAHPWDVDFVPAGQNFTGFAPGLASACG